MRIAHNTLKQCRAKGNEFECQHRCPKQNLSINLALPAMAVTGRWVIRASGCKFHRQMDLLNAPIAIANSSLAPPNSMSNHALSDTTQQAGLLSQFVMASNLQCVYYSTDKASFWAIKGSEGGMNVYWWPLEGVGHHFSPHRFRDITASKQ